MKELLYQLFEKVNQNLYSDTIGQLGLNAREWPWDQSESLEEIG